jgi:hypothetical protein
MGLGTLLLCLAAGVLLGGLLLVATARHNPPHDEEDTSW